MDHVLSELLTMTHPSQVTLHSLAHSFTELSKPLLHNKAVTHKEIRKQQSEPDMEQWTGSKLGKETDKAVYCHPAYLTYMQSTS